MTLDVMLFVSKRASAAVAALLCLAAVHLVDSAVRRPLGAAASASEMRVEIRR